MGKRREVLRQLGLLALAVTGIGLLNFLVVLTAWRAEGNPVSAKYPFLWEMTGAFCALLFLPFLIAFMRRFPLTRATLARRLPLHLAVVVAWGVCQTLLMWGSRSVLYRVLGWGRYDYGEMRWRFPMEGGKQLLWYCIGYAMVAMLESVRKAREGELTASRLRQELTEARLAALKMQLNPHFLFNTLNMISAHVREEPARAEAMIAHLSDFLRMTLRHSSAREVPLSAELAFLDAYLAIMKARFEERLRFEVAVEERARGTLVPHLLLQPLVENAVTHAMRENGVASVGLRARQREGRLLVTLEDDGPGVDGAADDLLGRGIGLTNTAERLRSLYGDAHRFEIGPRPGGGLRLEIEIPARDEEVPT